MLKNVHLLWTRQETTIFNFALEDEVQMSFEEISLKNYQLSEASYVGMLKILL